MIDENKECNSIYSRPRRYKVRKQSLFLSTLVFLANRKVFWCYITDVNYCRDRSFNIHNIPPTCLAVTTMPIHDLIVVFFIDVMPSARMVPSAGTVTLRTVCAGRPLAVSTPPLRVTCTVQATITATVFVYSLSRDMTTNKVFGMSVEVSFAHLRREVSTPVTNICYEPLTLGKETCSNLKKL